MCRIGIEDYWGISDNNSRRQLSHRDGKHHHTRSFPFGTIRWHILRKYGKVCRFIELRLYSRQWDIPCTYICYRRCSSATSPAVFTRTLYEAIELSDTVWEPSRKKDVRQDYERFLFDEDSKRSIRYRFPWQFILQKWPNLRHQRNLTLLPPQGPHKCIEINHFEPSLRKNAMLSSSSS